jgi:drug/metabolite transporter (DMT)-like permease
MSVFKKERPIEHMRRPLLMIQYVSAGVSSVIGSFAYALLSATVINSALRATAVLFALLSGTLVFHEKKLVIKIIIFFLISAGLVFLAR